MDLLLKNAHVYCPEDRGIVNIGICGEKIAYIGPDEPEAREIVECRGKVVLPGAIETHAHMLLPFGGTHTMNDFRDGTVAGAIGGVTTLIDFADQSHGKTVREALDERMEQARDCVVDYSFHCTLTDICERTLKEIPELVGEGITSFKFYTAYSASGLFVPEREMTAAFEKVAENNALATVHCETEAEVLSATDRLIQEGKTDIRFFSLSRPDESEESAVRNTISIADKTGAKLLIRHVSSAAGTALIAEAQRNGQTVIGETCPHYLLLTRDVYLGPHGEDYICNPPIRGERDREALWNALSSGVRFTIGTDDCAFYLRQKRVSKNFYEVPGGVPGIETRVPIMLSEGVGTGKLDYSRLAHLLSTDVAKVYGIYPEKGVIRENSDADLMVVEECEPYVLRADQLHEKSDYTPFEGKTLRHRVCMTVSRGDIIAKDQKYLGTDKRGRFLKRKHPASLEEL